MPIYPERPAFLPFGVRLPTLIPVALEAAEVVELLGATDDVVYGVGIAVEVARVVAVELWETTMVVAADVELSA